MLQLAFTNTTELKETLDTIDKLRADISVCEPRMANVQYTTLYDLLGAETPELHEVGVLPSKARWLAKEAIRNIRKEHPLLAEYVRQHKPGVHSLVREPDDVLTYEYYATLMLPIAKRAYEKARAVPESMLPVRATADDVGAVGHGKTLVARVNEQRRAAETALPRQRSYERRGRR